MFLTLPRETVEECAEALTGAPSGSRLEGVAWLADEGGAFENIDRVSEEKPVLVTTKLRGSELVILVFALPGKNRWEAHRAMTANLFVKLSTGKCFRMWPDNVGSALLEGYVFELVTEEVYLADEAERILGHKGI